MGQPATPKKTKRHHVVQKKRGGWSQFVERDGKSGAKLVNTLVDQCMVGFPYFNNYLNAIYDYL